SPLAQTLSDDDFRQSYVNGAECMALLGAPHARRSQAIVLVASDLQRNRYRSERQGQCQRLQVNLACLLSHLRELGCIRDGFGALSHAALTARRERHSGLSTRLEHADKPEQKNQEERQTKERLYARHEERNERRGTHAEHHEPEAHPFPAF